MDALRSRDLASIVTPDNVTGDAMNPGDALVALDPGGANGETGAHHHQTERALMPALHPSQFCTLSTAITDPSVT